MKNLLKNIQYAIDVFFYYLCLYYTKPVMGVTETPSSAIFIMAILFSLPVMGLSLVLSSLLHYDIGYLPHLLTIIPVCILTFKYFRKDNRVQKIIDRKPMFFNNHKLSIVLTILFVVFIWVSFTVAIDFFAVEGSK
jgi:hypothetical protein